MTKKISLPAPLRETYTTEVGWATRKWTEQGVRDVQACGGWFRVASEFESRRVARLAGVHLAHEPT